MRVIRASDYKATPWKNGGGSTAEIAIGPTGASLENFDWRISMAQVASDGPFSDFSGIDRTLAVIKGSGLVLTIGSDTPVTLANGTDPVSFSGDTPTSAHLTAGEITDLNVMTRRGRYRHRLQHIASSMSCDFSGSDIAVALSLDGSTMVSAESDSAILDHGDAVIISRTTTTDLHVSPATGHCYVVWLSEQNKS